ncbi:hypothetical protein BV898_06678 [Hypsibius exemplaris]|uniref:BED-type domain-containing protein n=1 Tax=Hypsibius exemplaris TaxID=2072580 RepID=A0A1W0WVM9_HYPEX|nr:hypothetical protein BV898_06678 [Hypsibius exemplaris]
MASKYGEEEMSDDASLGQEPSDGGEDVVSHLIASEAEPISAGIVVSGGGNSGSSRKRKSLPNHHHNNNNNNEDDGGSQSPSKRKESCVWRFYDRNLDRTKNCKICQKNFSANTATGALRKHLTAHFGEQTDKILCSAQTAMEVTISPSTNTVIVSGLPTSASSEETAEVITTTPISRRRAAPLPRLAPAPVMSAASSMYPPTMGPDGRIKQRYKSAVWEHFIRHEDGRPECIHCNVIYSATASTSGLRRHAETHEQQQAVLQQQLSLSEPSSSRPLKMARNKLAAVMAGGNGAPASLPNGAKTEPPVPRPARPFTAPPLVGEDNFLKLIIREHLPMADVAHQFGVVYRAATGKVPDGDALNAKLRQLFVRKKDEVKSYVRNAVGKITLSMEIWESASGHAYLLIAAHLLTDTWDPVRFLLDCLLISPDVTEEVVREMLIAVLEEYQCVDKILAISTIDEQTAARVGTAEALASKAVHLYQTYVEQHGGPEVAKVSCIGSGLGHCVEPALNVATEQVDKIRRFLKVLLNNGKFSELRNEAHLCLLDYHELKLDSPSVWTSTVAMLDSAVKMRVVIDKIVAQQNEGVCNAVTPDDWIVMEFVLELVSNYHLAAQDVGKTDYPALSIALPLLEFLTLNLKTQKDRSDIPAWVRKLASDMLQRTDAVLRSIQTDVYYHGTILDPRHKLTTIPATVNRHIVEDSLRAAFSRYLIQANGPTPTVGSLPAGDTAGITAAPLTNGTGTGGTATTTATPPSTSSATYRAGSLMSAILKKNQAATASLPQLDELNQYLNTSVEVPDADPLRWWENYRKVYPNLAQMARDYLAIPATAVPSPQLFVKERAAGKWRNRLDVEEVSLYVCLKSWVDVDFGHGTSTQAANVITIKRETRA